MVRLISVYIEFGNMTHLALVSVRQREEEFVCQVRYVDHGLHHKLPENLLVFDLNGSLKHPCRPVCGQLKSLLGNTIQAIRERLATS